MAGERTEKATPKRKRDERKKGNIFQSKEVVVVASLLIMFNAFKLLSPYFITTIQNCIRTFFGLMATTDAVDITLVQKYLTDGLLVFGMTALPLLFISGLVTVVFTGVQTRFLFTSKSMAFKFNRINPLEGFKKMFSMRSAVELLKALLKIAVLGYIIYDAMLKRLPQLPRLMDMEPTQALPFLGEGIMSIVSTIAYLFVILAILDYVYQWWEYEKSLRMSKQDIKEEYKMTEGDPQVKGKIKERQRQQAMSRMMQKVPTADVVIRNPTHYAVAIKYDAEKNRAPIVVAKGADHMALRIVKVAEEHGVIITENKPLARGLYEAVDLDREIPDQFYQPVAEVLAFVYSLKKKKELR